MTKIELVADARAPQCTEAEWLSGEGTLSAETQTLETDTPAFVSQRLSKANALLRAT